MAWITPALDQPDQLARIAPRTRNGADTIPFGNFCCPLQRAF